MPKGVYIKTREHKQKLSLANLGNKLSEETKRKIGLATKLRNYTNENHPMWKGDDVSYFGIHDWIKKHLVKPDNCKLCGKKTDKLDCSNISGEYKRELSDWQYVCRPCHWIFDNFRKRQL